MADRESRVVYKSRTLDRDEDRPRVPTALDPYDNPYYIAEPPRRKYNPADSTSTIDDGSSTTEVARSTTRSAYPERDDRAHDVYASRRRSTRTETLGSSDDVRTKKSVTVEQRRDDPRRSDPKLDNRVNRDVGYRDIGVDRPRERGREYYVDDRPRPAGAPYIVEARQGDVIDITTASRSRDYGYDRDPQRYRYDDSRSNRGGVYDRDYDRPSFTRDIDRVRGGNIVVLDKGYPPSPSRYQYEDTRSPRSATRGYDYDREDDWRIVDSMRDTRIGSTRPRDAYNEGSVRGRGETFSSEDSYVMVTPSQTSTPRHRERSISRSAIARRDYPEPELRRRRSRSISFRGSQVDYHDASERKHERPGVEAQVAGQYLGRRVAELDDDRSSIDRYASHQELDRRDRVDSDRFTATYRERDEPYAPQIGYEAEPDREPRRRDRSRRRRRDDEVNDDESYYSENVTRKTTTETRYR